MFLGFTKPVVAKSAMNKVILHIRPCFFFLEDFLSLVLQAILLKKEKLVSNYLSRLI